VTLSPGPWRQVVAAASTGAAGFEAGLIWVGAAIPHPPRHIPGLPRMFPMMLNHNNFSLNCRKFVLLGSRVTRGQAPEDDQHHALASGLGAAGSPGHTLRESGAGRVPVPASPSSSSQTCSLGVWDKARGRRAATWGTLCARVAGARLQRDGGILGRLGGEGRPTAWLFNKRQKPEPSASQLLVSGRLRHVDVPQGQPGGGASSCHHPTHEVGTEKIPAQVCGAQTHTARTGSQRSFTFLSKLMLHMPLRGGVRESQDLLVASRQTETHHAAERSCPLLCQQILLSSRLSTIATLRGRKEEPALQGE